MNSQMRYAGGNTIYRLKHVPTGLYVGNGYTKDVGHAKAALNRPHLFKDKNRLKEILQQRLNHCLVKTEAANNYNIISTAYAAWKKLNEVWPNQFIITKYEKSGVVIGYKEYGAKLV